MISRFLVISAFSASLLAPPMLASAQTGSTTTTPTPQTTGTMTGTTPGTMGTRHQMNGNMGTSSNMGSNMGHMSGNMAQSNSMDMSSSGFDARHYRTAADCLNAATAAHVSLSACSSPHKRCPPTRRRSSHMT